MDIFDQLTGKSSNNLTPVNIGEKSFLIHPEISNDFLNLISLAQTAQIRIYLVSSYRSFEHQCKIWNEKVIGKRPIMDHMGNNVLPYSVFKQLSQKEQLFTLLRWSAYPGLSRHHWGTDLDIYDGSQSTKSPELIPREYDQSQNVTDEDPPFLNLTRWLNHQIEQKSSYGFFRPFKNIKKKIGVGYEPWHISHSSSSRHYEEQITFSTFNKIIENNKEIKLFNEIKQYREEVFEHYIVKNL